jgi:hypothetical protein
VKSRGRCPRFVAIASRGAVALQGVSESRHGSKSSSCDAEIGHRRSLRWVTRRSGTPGRDGVTSRVSRTLRQRPGTAHRWKPRCRWMERLLARGRVPEVVIALATVEPPRLQTAALETARPNRTGMGRSVRASRLALCSRGRCGRQILPGFQRDTPRLRLREVSKAREVVLAWCLAAHGAPPQ